MQILSTLNIARIHATIKPYMIPSNISILPYLSIQGAIVSKQAEHVDHLTDCANTLMARDYKGFGNQGMNAVIMQKPTRKE